MEANKIYDSKFLTLIYDANKNILARHWKAASATMNTEEFKHEMLELLEAAKKYQPSGLLGNTYDFHYVILPDVQEWSDNNVYSKFAKIGVRKMAMVNSLDYYARLSVEQAITESPKAYDVEYFNNSEEAIAWLQS